MTGKNKEDIYFAPALREAFNDGYDGQQLRQDIIAGVTVGLIAVPLAMALAIASGVAPQYGLYTSIVAGFIASIFSGSRLGIVGPTAAFVVLLQPITAKYGLGGLLIATMLAGLIQLLLAATRVGRLIQFIPYPVTTGFTSGIAVVIAILQLKDFFGLPLSMLPHEFGAKIVALSSALPALNSPDLLIGAMTLAAITIWQWYKIRLPSHFIVLTAVSFLAWFIGQVDPTFNPATIGSRFTYEIAGNIYHGIPAMPPHLILLWQIADANGTPIGMSLTLLRELLPPAFGIALLGAIESLLCAVVADGFAKTKHYPNTELMAQGLTNIAIPFFGGITSTSAIARTSANFRFGAKSPIALAVHSLTILLIVVVFAKLMAYIPMAALAAILLQIAWNMSERKHFMRILKVAPKQDAIILLLCFSLTVIFDMVIAVGVGIVCASFLFMHRMTKLSGVNLTGTARLRQNDRPIPKQVMIYNIAGPLFFGAASTAIASMRRYDKEHKVLIIDMQDVPMLDMTGIVALESLLENALKDGLMIIISGTIKRITDKLAKAGIIEGAALKFTSSLNDAVLLSESMLISA